MSFADSQGGLPTPEFYTEYPVFVPEGSPELEDVSSIYKIVPIEDITPSSGVKIQLFDGDIGLKADIDSIEAYILWSDFPDKMYFSQGSSPGHIIELENGDFEFDSETGVLTITSQPKLTTILERKIADSQQLQENNPGQNFDNWSYYVVFQVNVEKYRSVADLRDLTSEQVGKIATAQAIEAAIFEYNYQFNLATQTQMSYHELFYTIIVTAISTAITMGATLCVGKVVQLTGSLANTATKELSKSASKTLLGLLQPTAGFTASGVAYAVLKEIGQEVLIDPWIESTVSGWVRRAGGDAMLQMVFSSVAESLRETLTGPFTNLFSSQQSGGVSVYERINAKYFSKGLTPTIQDLLNSFNDYKAEIKAQIDQQKEEITTLGRGFKVLTFGLVAVGFGVAQFIGPPTALLYTTLATFCFTEEISLKRLFSKVFNPVKAEVSKVRESKVGDYYRNNKKEILLTMGIGVAAVGLKALQTLLPPLALLGDFALGFGVPITIGMVSHYNLRRLNEHQRLPRVIAELYLDKLIQAMPKSKVREVLVENNKISKRGMAKATKEELLNLVYEHGLDDNLIKEVFTITGVWSWPRHIIRFLNRYNPDFYKFGEHLFSSRFGSEIYSRTGLPWSRTPFDEFTIGKLLDLFIKVKDPNLSFNARKNVISELDQYLRNNYPQLKSYEDVINKPIWLLGKALQQVLSSEEGKFLSLNNIGDKVLHDEHAFTFRYDSSRQMNRLTYQRITDFCKENLQNSDNIKYIDEMIEALSYAHGDIIFTSSNPKTIELALIQKISDKLTILKSTEHWRGDTPNFYELADLFGKSLNWIFSKTHMSESRIHNVFFEKDLNLISKVLKSKLLPVDKTGCQELLLELGKYDPDARQAELRKLFPTYKDWQGYEDKAIKIALLFRTR
jgi:hypothetical protein